MATAVLTDSNERYTITLDAVYAYQAELPRGCKGHQYVPRRFVLDVPAYQQKVLVECLSGKDAGLWFVCSLMNFARRYRRVEVQG